MKRQGTGQGRSWWLSGLAGLVVMAALPAAGEAADEKGLAAARTGLAVAIYRNDLALVREERSVSLSAGRARLAFEGVSPRMVPASVHLASSPPASVLAVDYDLDVLSAEGMLRRALGRDVGIVTTHPTTGEETLERATVVAVEGGLILRYRDRIETGAPGRLVFFDLPADMRPAPALLATLGTSGTGAHVLDLSYLTEGLAWEADYVIALDEGGERADVAARATVRNGSGANFDSARVTLIAGEVRRVSSAPPVLDAPAPMARAMTAAEAAPVTRESVGDFHEYTLPEPVTLADRGIKLVSLFALKNVAIEREYVSESSFALARGGGDRTQVDHPFTILRLVNPAGAGAQPLPAGVARIFGRRASAAPVYLGEDLITDTPVGGRVELRPGRAFDVTVTRRQTAYTRAALEKGVFEASYAIEVHNGRDGPATVRVVEVIPGDWTILQSSQPHEKDAADRAVFPVSVAAGARATVTYSVRVQR